MYSGYIKSLFAFLILSYGVSNYAYAADDSKLNRSNQLFDFAEENFPQYFSPSGTETFELDDYWARYFSKTDTYIGTLGDDVYVYGVVFDGLLYIGKMSDFIALGKCGDNAPKPACDAINTGLRSHFESGASCSNAFPDYEYDPSLFEGSDQVCGLGFIECGACAVDQ